MDFAKMELDPALAPLASTNKPGRPPLPGGARRIGVSLPIASYEALGALVARSGRPLSEYVRDVLVTHVDALTGSDDDLVDEDPDQPMSVQDWLDAQDPPTEHELDHTRSKYVSMRERIAKALEEPGSRSAPATINWDAILAPSGLLASTVVEDRPLVCRRHDFSPIMPADQLPIDLGEEG